MGAPVTLTTVDPTSGAQTAQGTAANPIFTATNSLQITSDLTAAIVDRATSGDFSPVAGVAGQTIRVHRLRMSVAGAVIITVKSGTTTVLEKLKFPGAGIHTYDFATRPWYKTASGQDLVINLSAAVQTDAIFEYVRSA